MGREFREVALCFRSPGSQGSELSGLKVWITIPGKQLSRAEVLAKSEEILEKMEEEK